MTMLTTMIWEVQIRVKIMHALFLADHKSIHILEEEELVENQQKQVRNIITMFQNPLYMKLNTVRIRFADFNLSL